MTRRSAAYLAAPLALALALAGCGRSNDAATEAQQDTVEVPANEAMQSVTSTPVADPSANAVPTSTSTTATPELTEEEKIQAAGDDAADTAAAAADAMDETTTTEKK